jgi:acetyl-CoA carboxylase carboxyl transferase subunit alpha
MSAEKDYYQLENKVQEYKDRIDKELESETPSREKIDTIKKQIISEWEKLQPRLTALHRVQIARHPQRPYTWDYIKRLTQDFLEFHGDRRAGDDPAVVAGFGRFQGESVAVIGHQKGRTTRERINRNFGQPNPEGYRKALRVMKLAEKYRYPIITLIDTPGAYPGIEGEERGQAEAIAFNLKEISQLKVPVLNVIIGEGGSGGALAVGVGDKLLMLENSFYSVISPEGCAAILWKDQTALPQAAENLRFLARDLREFGIADKIIPEPPGGAHIDWETTFEKVDQEIQAALEELKKLDSEKRIELRYQKYRKMGVFTEK